MRTQNEKGERVSPMRLMEMLESRFGVFEALAYTSLELARKEPEEGTPMDAATAEAVLEFADDIRQAYAATLEWASERELLTVTAREDDQPQMRLQRG